MSKVVKSITVNFEGTKEFYAVGQEVPVVIDSKRTMVTIKHIDRIVKDDHIYYDVYGDDGFHIATIQDEKVDVKYGYRPFGKSTSTN